MGLSRLPRLSYTSVRSNKERRSSPPRFQPTSNVTFFSLRAQDEWSTFAHYNRAEGTTILQFTSDHEEESP